MDFLGWLEYASKVSIYLDLRSGIVRMVQRRKDKAARQAEIMEAAKKVIIRHGSEHVTINRIAREVGISEAAIYRHFKSKRDVLSLLVEHIGGTLIDDIIKVRADSHSPLETLNRILRCHISAIEQRRGVSFQVIAEIISLGDKKLNRKASEAITSYVSQLQDLMSEGVKAGELKENLDLEASSMLLFGMVQGLVNVWALGNYGFDLEQKYLSLWQVFRTAIARR